jgi:hypothetical protein
VELVLVFELWLLLEWGLDLVLVLKCVLAIKSRPELVMVCGLENGVGAGVWAGDGVSVIVGDDGEEPRCWWRDRGWCRSWS